MTRTKKRRPYQQTAVAEDRKGGGDPRFLCYAAGPLDVQLRLKGTRKAVTLPWASLWRIAMDREAAAKLEAKAGRQRKNYMVRRGTILKGGRR